MANPNFVPNFSSNEIFRDLDQTRCLTDDLDAMDTLIAGKAPADHVHSGYAVEDHTHDGYAPSTHTHTGFAAENHSHSEYASSGHGHSEYASSGHDHDGDYAPMSHSHSGYASSSHTHSDYASSTHDHDDDYFPVSGGTVSGNVNVAGIVRVNNKQAIYDSGSMTTLATNNQPTMIAGSQVYSKTAITVSSDRRLKRDIETLSTADLAEFVNKLSVVSYNYNDDAADAKARIGLVAQDVQTASETLANFFVDECVDGMLGVKTADLVFALIATVQELKQEIDTLKANQ